MPLSGIFFIVVVVLFAWYLWERIHRQTGPIKPGLNADINLAHEQPFELYHNSFSHCARKVRICLAELGVDYKSHEIDLIETGAYENISQHYLKVNPSGLVPVLVHNGNPVYESDEIIAYAARHAGLSAPKLVPEDEAKRAEMEAWIERANLPSAGALEDFDKSAGRCVPVLTLPIFFTAIRYIPTYRIFEGLLFHHYKERALMFLAFKVMGIKRLPKIERLRKLIRKGREAMGLHLAALEDQVKSSGGPWLLGAEYTLADVTWTAVLLRLEEGEWLEHFFAEDALPELQAYWQRLKARPSYKAAILDMQHETVTRATKDLHYAKKWDPALHAALMGA